MYSTYFYITVVVLAFVICGSYSCICCMEAAIWPYDNVVCM